MSVDLLLPSSARAAPLRTQVKMEALEKKMVSCQEGMTAIRKNLAVPIPLRIATLNPALSESTNSPFSPCQSHHTRTLFASRPVPVFTHADPLPTPFATPPDHRPPQPTATPYRRCSPQSSRCSSLPAPMRSPAEQRRNPGLRFRRAVAGSRSRKLRCLPMWWD